MRRTMTEQQLEQIAALRRENYPYSFIGRELGLSPNTVKSVCHSQQIPENHTDRESQRSLRTTRDKPNHRAGTYFPRHGSRTQSPDLRAKERLLGGRILETSVPQSKLDR